MSAGTAIGWCDDTFNPWWGCARVSPGCLNCYAEATAKRWGTQWGKDAERRFFGDKHWAEPLRWNREAESWPRRRRVFCASMADVFEDRDDLVPHRERLFDLIEATPNLDWLLLTKRPENVTRLVRWSDLAPWSGWPRNVWLGVTVEDQRRADERIHAAVNTCAPLVFLSCEPLLGPLILSEPLEAGVIDWVIIGGESGPKARRMAWNWAQGVLLQCESADVPVFFKQAGKVLGREWGCSKASGEDWDAWPEWARVREHPDSVA